MISSPLGMMPSSFSFSAVTCRPITPEDQPFLLAVYASTRTEELAMVPWNDAEKSAFLHMQFTAQHKFYQENYQQADYLVLSRNAEQIGRLYLDRRQDEIRIMDITLLPVFRNQGIGSALLKEIIATAQAAHLPVRIHVEHFNRALELYKRLDFHQIGDTGVYFLMEWVPKI